VQALVQKVYQMWNHYSSARSHLHVHSQYLWWYQYSHGNQSQHQLISDCLLNLCLYVCQVVRRIWQSRNPHLFEKILISRCLKQNCSPLQSSPLQSYFERLSLQEKLIGSGLCASLGYRCQSDQRVHRINFIYGCKRNLLFDRRSQLFALFISLLDAHLCRHYVTFQFVFQGQKHEVEESEIKIK